MQYSINIAAQRSGLTTHTIRIWEKRYRAVEPERSQTNRRVYSDEDIERLRLLRLATEAGHTIRHVANLSQEDLESLVAKEQLRHSAEGEATRLGGWEERCVRRCLAAVDAMEPQTLQARLKEAVVRLGYRGMINRVVAPLVHRMGEQWADGLLTAGHEHFASSILKVYLLESVRPFALDQSAPAMISATPSGQLHELGAVLATAAASSAGWRVFYLGANLPAAEIAGAAVQNRVRAVALSVVYPPDDSNLPNELLRLDGYLSPEISLILGGRSIHAYHDHLHLERAVICDEIEDFYSVLDRLRDNEQTEQPRGGKKNSHSPAESSNQ